MSKREQSPEQQKLLKMIQIVKGERHPSLKLPEGTYRLRVVKVLDEKPYEYEYKGVKRYAIRLIVEDVDGKLEEDTYTWWISLGGMYDPEESTIAVPERGTSLGAQILRLMHDHGGIEGMILSVTVTGSGRDRRYTVEVSKPVEYEEVTAPAKIPKPTKPEAPTFSAENIRNDYERMMSAGVLSENEVIIVLSEKYKVSKEDIKKIVGAGQ